MRIAITATGPDLEAKVDPRFGRCPHFLIVETEDLSFEAVENPNAALGSGAGIQSARLMAERGVKHVLTGNCGPNAHQTLSAAGIEVIVGCSGAVRDVIEQFKAGQLVAAAEPNVASHFGTGVGSAGTADPAGDAGPAFGPGMGRGGGRGMGRGMGMGRGGGRGRGRGMGRGMGMGGGTSMGPEAASSQGLGPVPGQPVSCPTDQGELGLLKQHAEALTQQLQQIQQRIQELEQEKKNG
jgi:predicted Fe-Mo cluster-binding NifX family protein